MSTVVQPLPEHVRQMLEHTLAADLSALRVHTGPPAADWARALGAEAFTYGPDIYFGAGAFRPDTAAGMWLLAHETTHALQQSRRPAAGAAAPGCGGAAD